MRVRAQDGNLKVKKGKVKVRCKSTDVDYAHERTLIVCVWKGTRVEKNAYRPCPKCGGHVGIKSWGQER